MKKKFDWNAPMSRKDYGILCGLALGFYAICCGISMAIIYEFSFKDWIWGKIKNKFGSLYAKDLEEEYKAEKE